MDAPTQNQRNLQKLLEAMDSKSMTHEEFVRSFQLVMDAINKLKANNQTEFALMKRAIDTLSAKVKADAQDDTKEIRAVVQSEMKKMVAKIEQKVLEMDAQMDAADEKMESLEDGKDAKPEDVVPLVLAALPPDVEETGDEIIVKINGATELIEPTAVRGLAELERMVGEGPKGTNRPGWGAHPLVVQQSGVVKDKVTRVLNFTGATVTRSAQGVTTVAITGGSGSGYQAPLSGGLTGTNTWTTAPSVLVIDGVPKQQVQTDGTRNWTGTTTTVLTNAPLPTFDIFSTS